MFADRLQFDNFRKSSEQRFLSVETFTDYRKSLEARMKSMEERLGTGFYLLAINLYSHKRDKDYRSILAGLRIFKDIKFEGFPPFLAFLFLAMIAVHLICSIND